MKKETRKLVNFYELDPIWQVEAIDNHETEEIAAQQLYIKPLSNQSPEKHVLYDLSECMRSGNDSDFDGIIPITNVMALGIKIIDDNTVELRWLD